MKPLSRIFGTFTTTCSFSVSLPNWALWHDWDPPIGFPLSIPSFPINRLSLSIYPSTVCPALSWDCCVRENPAWKSSQPGFLHPDCNNKCNLEETTQRTRMSIIISDKENQRKMRTPWIPLGTTTATLWNRRQTARRSTKHPSLPGNGDTRPCPFLPFRQGYRLIHHLRLAWEEKALLLLWG